MNAYFCVLGAVAVGSIRASMSPIDPILLSDSVDIVEGHGPMFTAPDMWHPPTMTGEDDIEHFSWSSGDDRDADFNPFQIPDLPAFPSQALGIVSRRPRVETAPPGDIDVSGTSWDDEDDTWWSLSGIAPAGPSEIKAIAAEWGQGSVESSNGVNTRGIDVKRLRQVSDEGVVSASDGSLATSLQGRLGSDASSTEAHDALIGDQSARPAKKLRGALKRPIITTRDAADAHLVAGDSPPVHTATGSKAKRIRAPSVSLTDIQARRRELVCEFVAANPDKRGSMSRQAFATLVGEMLARHKIPSWSHPTGLIYAIKKCGETFGGSYGSIAARRRAFIAEYVAKHPDETNLAAKINKELEPMGLAYPNSVSMSQLLATVKKEKGVWMQSMVTPEQADERKRIVEDYVRAHRAFDPAGDAEEIADLLEAADIPVPASKYLKQLVREARTSLKAEERRRRDLRRADKGMTENSSKLDHLAIPA